MSTLNPFIHCKVFTMDDWIIYGLRIKSVKVYTLTEWPLSMLCEVAKNM